MTGAAWSPAKAPVSPCPTLRVISFVTALLDRKELLQREVESRQLARTPSQGLSREQEQEQEARLVSPRTQDAPATMGEAMGRLAF